MTVPSKKISNGGNLEAPIVIVGWGGAGLAAAVTFAEMGTKPLLLEKRRVMGGNTAMAEALIVRCL